LASFGWQGFIAANRRAEDDWVDPSGLVLHQQLAAESLKERCLGAEAYCSLLLRRARKQFVDQGYAANFGNWGSDAYVTPVTLAKLEDERQGYSRKWQVQHTYLDRAARARSSDLKHVDQPMDPNLSGSPDAVYRLIESVQTAVLAGCGFTPDRAMSVKHGPVLSRPIDDEWKLATTLLDRHLVSPRQFGATPSGNLSLTLVLAHHSVRVGDLERALARNPDRVVVLSLLLFVNFQSQDPTVIAYVGGTELEARVRFHSDLISLVLPDLIPALARGLSHCWCA
jgi:hypothetical protein